METIHVNQEAVPVSSTATMPYKGDALRIQCPQCTFNKGRFCYKRLKDVDDLHFLKWCPYFLYKLKDYMGTYNH